MTGYLSVVIPCYNESQTIRILVNKVLQQSEVGQVIVVDDGSTDGSVDQLKDITDSRLQIYIQPKNRGKGSAVSLGFKKASKPYVVIQDADLEYEPEQYGSLLKPMLSGHADVVFGSRFLTASSRRVLYFRHKLGNQFLTFLSNLFSNIDLTDMETCFKVMKLEIAQNLNLREKRFGLEPEITAKLAAAKHRIYEVPISYHGRTYDEGKKINWKDGISAIRCILKYNLFVKK